MIATATAEGMAQIDEPQNTPDPRFQCVVQAFERDKELCGLWITFTGAEFRFPSKNKKQGRYGWSSDSKASLEALSLSFRAACKNRYPTFGTDLIKVIALIPPPPSGNRFDSHNLAESIADWLQLMEVVANDSQIQIECIKRTEVDSFSSYLLQSGYSGFSEGRNSTTLICLPRDDQISRIIHASTLELIKLSTGRLKLYG